MIPDIAGYMKGIAAILLIFCLSKAYGLSAPVTISGIDSAYAGETIELLAYNNEITYTENTLATSIVDKTGQFSLHFEVEEVRYVFAYLGIYRVYLYVEPGKSYRVLLPPRQEKTPSDMLNPYFAPTEVHLATKDFDKKELNTRIRMFDDSFLPYSNKHILAIRNKEDFSDLDKDISQMDRPFADSDDTFFNDYRTYKYGYLRHLAYQQKSRSISDEYFRNQPVLLNNPAYMLLFNQVYDKYFHHFSRTPEGQALTQAISASDKDQISQLLASDSVFGNGDLMNLVILKGLHDEFYDDNYSRSALLQILEAYANDSANEAFSLIAADIIEKTTRLLAGFEPPDFELLDRDSSLVSLVSLRGKYVYLNFCSCFSYTCLNEFKMLETLYEKHSEILEIVTIIIDNDKDVINGFLERSGYSWVFLHYGKQPEILREYDIRAFPTYYLIDPEGKLVVSPAPAPGDDFEARLFKIMRTRGEL